MALKTTSVKKKETVEEPKVEVKAKPQVRSGDKPYELIREEDGKLSIRIKR